MPNQSTFVSASTILKVNGRAYFLLKKKRECFSKNFNYTKLGNFKMTYDWGDTIKW